MPEPVVGSRGQDVAGLVDREGALITEHVAKGSQVGGCGRQHLFDNEAHVGLPVVAVLGRDHMGTEESGYHIDWHVFGDGGRHFQHAELGLDVQPVAGFHLDGCRTGSEHALSTLHGIIEKRRGVGGASRLDGALDAASRCHDFLVTLASQAAGELVGAVAAKHEVGVAVDEPRDDGPTGAIEFRKVPELAQQVGFGPHPGNSVRP